MVHIVDEGSHFDVPVETIWKFLQAQEHGESHSDHRNPQMSPLSGSSAQVSWEQDMDGKPVKVVSRVTNFAPLGVAIEVLEGPMAGSKFFNYYTPKGSKTAVTVVGDFKSPVIPETHLEAAVRQNLEHVFTQDSAALHKFNPHK